MPDGSLILSIVYDPAAKQFRQNGRVVSNETVRNEIDRLTEYVEKQAKVIGERFAKGSISAAQFEIELRELLKSAHIIAASVGRGGRARMRQADWAVVGNKIKWQYGFLRRLTNNLQRGKIAKAFAPSRAKKYASSVLVSYYTTVQKEYTENGTKSGVKVRRILHAKESCEGCKYFASLGWIEVDAMPLLGELECGDFDRCTLEFSDDVSD